MDDSGYSPSEIKDFVQQIVERANCEVVNWQQDPCDSSHLFIAARLKSLPSETAPVQLEVRLPFR